MKSFKNSNSKSKGVAPVYKCHLWPLGAADTGNPLTGHPQEEAGRGRVEG